MTTAVLVCALLSRVAPRPRPQFLKDFFRFSPTRTTPRKKWKPRPPIRKSFGVYKSKILQIFACGAEKKDIPWYPTKSPWYPLNPFKSLILLNNWYPLNHPWKNWNWIFFPLNHPGTPVRGSQPFPTITLENYRGPINVNQRYKGI